jgi:hypothetical protein
MSSSFILNDSGQSLTTAFSCSSGGFTSGLRLPMRKNLCCTCTARARVAEGGGGSEQQRIGPWGWGVYKKHVAFGLFRFQNVGRFACDHVHNDAREREHVAAESEKLPSLMADGLGRCEARASCAKCNQKAVDNAGVGERHGPMRPLPAACSSNNWLFCILMPKSLSLTLPSLSSSTFALFMSACITPAP